MALWTRVLLVLAGAKVLLWLGIGAPGVDPLPRAVLILSVVVFSTTSGLLLAGSGTDSRAVPLAACWAITATSFTAYGPDSHAALPAVVATGFHYLALHAFAPFYIWRFFSEFPRVPLYARGGRLFRVGTGLAAAFGSLLLGANLLQASLLALAGPDWLTSSIARFALEQGGLQPAIRISLTLPAFALALYRSRIARPNEQRRVRLLTVSMIGGSLPVLVLSALYSIVPSFRPILLEPPTFRVAQVIVYSGLLAIPLATAYAVLVQRALDVKLVLRATLQYALARTSVLGLSLVPFALLVGLLFKNRDQPLVDLLTGSRGFALLGASLLGVIVYKSRQRVLERLDAHFFREQYDARSTLEALAREMIGAQEIGGLARILRSQLDKALHLERVTLLRVDADREMLLDQVRPLDLRSALARIVLRKNAPVVLDLGRSGSVARALPERDQEWLADGGFELLAPLVARDTEPLGMLALGAKRSGLPFSSEDLRLLSTVSSSAYLALDSLKHRFRSSPEQSSASRDELAVECSQCGLVLETGTGQCLSCTGTVRPAPLPHVLAGKFRVERRLGAGGMGVVYRAFDIDLCRPVAIKTLPKLDPCSSPQLRREARFMASVSHPNLALILGVEAWHGTPMLVIEYLPGGTLALALTKGPLKIAEAVTLGVTLAEVAASIHRAGVIHRDIKPSNIGFSGTGELKLLDFGVASMIETLQTSIRDASLFTAPEDSTMATRTTVVQGGRGDGRRIIAGTLPYMSPEALSGEEPEPGFDIWSICVLLYESIAGRHPAEFRSVDELRRRISDCDFPPLSQFLTGCPAPVVSFFTDALSPRRSRRPRTGDELRTRLEALQGSDLTTP